MTSFDERDFLERAASPFGDEAWLAAIVRSAADGIIAWDLEGTVTCWNGAAERMLGHSAAAMIGRPVRALIPDHRRRTEEAMLACAVSGKPVTAFSTERIADSGTEVAMNVAMTPVLDAEGGVIGVSEQWRPATAERTPADLGRVFTGSRHPPAGRSGWMLADGPAPFGGADAEASEDPNILVVEDEVLTAFGLIATLENAGFQVIGPACDVRAGMELLDSHRCVLAILDVNLGDGETSAPLAERLKEAGIPFFVTSGYSAEHRPPVFNEAPNFPKPVPARVIVTAVRDILQ